MHCRVKVTWILELCAGQTSRIKLHTLSGARRSVPLLLAQRALQTVISDHFASFRQTIHSGPTPKPGSWPLKADLKPVTAEKSKRIGYCQRGFLFHATTAAVHRVWVKPRNSFSKICHIPWSCMLNLSGVWRPYAAPQLRLLLVYLQSSSPRTSPWCLCDILYSLWLEGGSSQSRLTSAPEPALYMSEERNKVRPKPHYFLFALESKLYIPEKIPCLLPVSMFWQAAQWSRWLLNQGWTLHHLSHTD